MAQLLRQPQLQESPVSEQTKQGLTRWWYRGTMESRDAYCRTAGFIMCRSGELSFAAAYLVVSTLHSAINMRTSYESLQGKGVMLRHLRTTGSRAGIRIETRTKPLGDRYCKGVLWGHGQDTKKYQVQHATSDQIEEQKKRRVYRVAVEDGATDKQRDE